MTERAKILKIKYLSEAFGPCLAIKYKGILKLALSRLIESITREL